MVANISKESGVASENFKSKASLNLLRKINAKVIFFLSYAKLWIASTLQTFALIMIIFLKQVHI